MAINPSYRQSVRMVAAALCAEARGFIQRNGTAAAPPPGVSPREMEDFFLTITEHALEALPNEVLIAILGGKMRDKLRQAGFDMDKILPLSATQLESRTEQTAGVFTDGAPGA